MLTQLSCARCSLHREGWPDILHRTREQGTLWGWVENPAEVEKASKFSGYNFATRVTARIQALAVVS